MSVWGLGGMFLSKRMLVGRTAHQVYTVDDWVLRSGNIDAVASKSGRKVLTLV
jgi:hypothetical protein